MAIALGLLLPWLLVAAAIAWRVQAWAWLLVPAATIIAITGAWRSRQGIDDAWVARRLDASDKNFEDSAALLLQSPAQLPLLAQWQRDRIASRLDQLRPVPDLRPAWPHRAMLTSAVASLAIALAIAWLPTRTVPDAGRRADAASVPAGSTALRLVSQEIRIQPPSYTGLPARTEKKLPTRVPENSRLAWTLQFSGEPSQVTLVFHDGSRLALEATDGAWTGSRTLSKSTLYRVLLGSDQQPASALQRIDVVADKPPQIRVLAPDRSLSLLDAGQETWSLGFEASDDFGLGAAQLRITLAQGSGENITVSARTMSLPGKGDARKRIYRHQLDLASSGFAVGDDLVVRLSVNDNRQPAAQTTRSASFILRWPPETGAEATGVEGMIKRTLPAYFRSQRQIIIDSEALLAERRKLSAEKFLQRSDEIGVDQRLLRLRYGQFLGEETSHAQETAEDAPEVDATATGDATSVVEAFGHIHDEAEAATLLDPDTRKLLKSALDEMWQSELHLRQGNPQKALPYEYRALRLIKQVQNASRIYLARVGLQLPPVDETRRMGGDRSGANPAGFALSPAELDASPARRFWQLLEGGTPASLDAVANEFETWLRANEGSVPDALGVFAAMDAWRSDRACVACAEKLRERLWQLLPAPVPAIEARTVPDARGRAYLDALQEARKP
ncbi:MAG: hypothetical protein A3E01_19575 [Gammaproteobacteria bacterium RIFCSPHIGHO2_12_FULL_63_22]|nr:MAG: hypothetical protein A3E01_19575 [Gammaproteobacteria bacterium RIFCSPHIGHO2_12_FULL_63_22]